MLNSGELIGMMGIIVIQEGEEGAIRPATRQPIEEFAIHDRGPFAIGMEKPPELIHGGFQEIKLEPIFEKPLHIEQTVHGTIDEDVLLQRSEPRKDVITIYGKAPVQPRVRRAIPVIGGETGGRVSAHPRYSARVGYDSSKGVIQPAESS